MARYSAPLQQATVSSSFKSLGVLWAGSTARRLSLYEFDLGQPGALNTSTDCQMQYDVSRFTLTNAGAGTAATPASLDPGDSVASSASYMNLVTTEFTPIAAATGILQIPINQRGTFRWRALDDGDNVIIPATNPQGITTRVLSSAYTGTSMGNIHYQDL
jgi:hypothetical protein